MKRIDDTTLQLLDLHRKIVSLQGRLTARVQQKPPEGPMILNEVLDDLHLSIEELQVAHEELRAQNEELIAARLELEEQKNRYHDLFTFAPDPYFTTDAHGRILEANRAVSEMFGIEWTFLKRKPLLSFIASESRRQFHTVLNQARTAPGSLEVELRIQPRHRPPFDASVTMAMAHDHDGEPAGIRWMIRDISARVQHDERSQRFHTELEERVAERTEELEAANRMKDELLRREKAARQAAEEAQSRFRFLAETAEVMSSSLCYETTLQTVAHMAIPRLADWCFVDIIEEDGSIWRLAIAADSPAKERLGRRMLSGYAPGEGAQNRLLGNVIANGTSQILPEITEDLLLVIAQDSHHLSLLKALDPRSAMIVPLVTRGRTLGAMTFVGTTRPSYTQEDLDLAEELAHRAAIAVDNARLYRRAQTEIEERERIEERLRKSETRFRRLYQSDMISIAFFDLDGRITDANDQFLTMVGCTREQLRNGELRWDELTPPEWMPRTRAAVEEMKARTLYHPYEKEYVHSDGTRFPVLLGGAMIDDHEGVAFVLDLTGVKTSERMLQERMDQIQTIYELTSSVARARSLDEIYEEAMTGLERALGVDRVSILLFDDGGTMRFKMAHGLSPEYCRSVEGHSPWKANEKNPEPIAIDDVAGAAHLGALRETILAEGIAALAFVPLIYQGRLLGKFMLYYNQPHTFGREELQVAETIAGHVAFAIGRRETEEALIRSETRFRALTEANVIGIVNADMRGAILDANDEFLRIIGYSRRDLLTGRLDWRKLTPPEHREQDERIAEDLRRIGHSAPCEKEYYRKDGSRAPVLLGVALLSPGNDETICFVLDMSARKQAEIELMKAKEQAEEASRAKDHFLAVLSHELRTPLAPVLAAAQALETEPKIPEDLRPMIQIILRNVELQGRLIDDMLDLTRIVKGKLRLTMDTVNIHDLLRNVVQVCQAETALKGLTLRVELDATAFHVHADPARLQQVFWNVLKNAVKFTPPGGTITLGSRNEENRIILKISDTGIGIDPEDLQRIFGAFEQAGESRAGRYGGLGLGLAISKALIDRQQGTLAASSEGKGRGATFTVTLPTVPVPGPASVPKSRQEPEKRRPGARILLVEDHTDTRRVLDMLLTHHGYTVLTATSIDSAMKVASTEEFDLLLSDLKLTDGSGLDLVRMVRDLRSVRAIALSGYQSPDDLIRCREAGFDEHLSKPVDSRKLCDTIAKLVNRG